MSNTKNNYSFYLDKITSLFTEEWNEAVKSISSRKKSILNKYMPLIFKRWFFSALIEDSVLTPANLVALLNTRFGKPETDTPNLIWEDRADKKAVHAVKMLEYTVENHPVVNDLKLFLDILSPTFDLSTFKDKTRPDGFDGLSRQDGDYLEFLCMTATALKLVKKMPSINAAIAQVSSSRHKFFEYAPDVILTKITEATVDLCILSLSEILPVDKTFKAKLMSFLKKPKSIDDIFQELFFASGIDIDKLFDDFNHNLDVLNEMFGMYNDDDTDFELEIVSGGDEDEEQSVQSLHADLMSGTFFLGIALDHYFITPLSYYLRLIQPLYIIPYNLGEEIVNFCECLPQINDSEAMIYAPCTTYALTELGARLFGAEDRGAEGVMLPADTPIESIILTLKELIGMSELGILDGEEVADEVVTLKVKLSLNKKYWQTIEVYGDETLDSLHVIICRAFMLDEDCEYSFYKGAEENPFKEYTPKTNKKKQRKTETVSLSDLEMNVGDCLKYLIYDSVDPYGPSVAKKKVAFDIEVAKLELKRSAVCPKIVRKSKLVTDYNEGK